MIDICYDILNCVFIVFFVDKNIFSWDGGISKHLLLMFCVGAIAYIVLIVIEVGTIRMIKQLIFSRMKRHYPDENSVTDDDVLREKERIDRMELNELKSEMLVMKDVSKFYGSFCAVNKTSILINRYIPITFD